MSRDTSVAAPGWQCLPMGGWVRQPPRGSTVTALVRREGAAFVMRVATGAWQPAGDTLLAATEHAGGHAVRLELMAQRGGQDLVGNCATCARMGAKEGGR